MKVLVACEESQRVCTAFRERGHEAYSCDIIEPSGGHPEWHILGDALEAIKGGAKMDGGERRQAEARQMTTYEQALDHYGGEMQTMVCVEEMSELMKELSKHARGADNVRAIAEEIADVEIMLEQMKLLHGCARLATVYKDEKLERLKRRIGME